MNVWYAVAIAGAILLLESFVSLAMRHEIRGNIVRVCSGAGLLILSLLSLRFDWFGAGIIVESNLWYAVSSAGVVLFLEGGFSTLASRIMKRDFRSDIIRAFSGLIAFVVGFILLFITGG